jgi:hypothetical protein
VIVVEIVVAVHMQKKLMERWQAAETTVLVALWDVIN